LRIRRRDDDILAKVPFALIGGILALYLTGIHLIGGLFSAAALTLVVLPALYVIFEGRHRPPV
jgi:Cu/Ag efflux pump CusA